MSVTSPGLAPAEEASLPQEARVGGSPGFPHRKQSAFASAISPVTSRDRRSSAILSGLAGKRWGVISQPSRLISHAARVIFKHREIVSPPIGEAPQLQEVDAEVWEIVAEGWWRTSRAWEAVSQSWETARESWETLLQPWEATPQLWKMTPQLWEMNHEESWYIFNTWEHVRNGFVEAVVVSTRDFRCHFNVARSLAVPGERLAESI